MKRRYDYTFLTNKITSKYGNLTTFGSVLGQDYSTFSRKINNHSEFKQSEMERICDLLGLSISNVPKLFFCHQDS